MFFFFSSRRRHTRCALVTGVQTCALPIYPGLVEGTPLSPGWLPSNNPYRIAPGTSAGDRDAIARYVRASVQAHHILLRALVEAGVPVIAGTDADNAVAIPGVSLHDVMQALVDAGLSSRSEEHQSELHSLIG